MKVTKNEIYRHYIALDWSQEIVAIASMRDTSTEPEHTTILPDLKIMNQYLKSRPGKKMLAIEKTTTSHWLYLELRIMWIKYSYVMHIVIVY